ncbi:hypothetical protein BBJ28_00016409 [Nothophytophthora sp. Chile5]|nr:hypothetical protein BBJ28_00016409 [Nothophytophthora sp. Chile5]
MEEICYAGEEHRTANVRYRNSGCPRTQASLRTHATAYFGGCHAARHKYACVLLVVLQTASAAPQDRALLAMKLRVLAPRADGPPPCAPPPGLAAWTADEVAFVAALLSDEPDEPSLAETLPPAADSPPAQAAAGKARLSPTEKAAARRRSHRETMRRSRQRFRDQIDEMLATVERLEAVKARGLEKQRRVEMSAPDAGLQGQVAFLEAQQKLLLGENDALHAQLVASLLAITRAHPGNFEHERVPGRAYGDGGNGGRDDATGADFHAMAAGGSDAAVRRDPVTLCDFVTWDVSTVGHCLQLVRDSAGEIAQFYATAAAGGHAQQLAALHDGDMMGWRTTRRRSLAADDTRVQFAFDKTFPGHSAAQLFHKTWAFCRNQRAFAALLAPVVRALQLEVLHQINDDIVVVRRMQEELDVAPTKYRSIYLLYRMASPAGLFVVLRSVNPSFTRRCGCANNAWVESFLWFGFSSVTPSDCRVRFGGSMDGSSPAFARRWQREIFFLLLRWETINVAPFVLLPAQDSA